MISNLLNLRELESIEYTRALNFYVVRGLWLGLADSKWCIDDQSNIDYAYG